MLTGFQEKKLGDDTWPRGGVIKPQSWCQLGGTYGMLLTAVQHNYIVFSQEL